MIDCAEKEGVRFSQYEGSPLHAGCAEGERDASMKVSSLAPARVAVPGGHRVVAVAAGLHHTVMLTEHGECPTLPHHTYRDRISDLLLTCAKNNNVSFV